MNEKKEEKERDYMENWGENRNKIAHTDEIQQ